MSKTAPNQLRSLVERIERIEETIKEFNSDKSDIYTEAKSSGFDVKALKAVIAHRRKDPGEAAEHDVLVDTYLSALGGGTLPATRVRAHGTDTPPQSTPPTSKSDLAPKGAEPSGASAAGEHPPALEPAPPPARRDMDDDLRIPDFLWRGPPRPLPDVRPP